MDTELIIESDVDLVDEAARSLLNISGDKFRERWDSDFYANDTDPRIMSVAVLLSS